MNKTIVLLSLLFIFYFSSKAQSMYGDKVKVDVKMNYVYSFEEALKAAKKENKLIFFNCFADWAGPCHAMNKFVFSDQDFSDWMDKNFVNFFMDVTTKEGEAFASKYSTHTMAHYLVLDQQGEVVHRIVGGHQIPKFKEILTRALDPKTSLAGMTDSFEAGERSVSFLRDYFEVLRIAGQTDKSNNILDLIFSEMKPTDYSKEENWRLVVAKVRNSNDEIFKDVVKNKKDYVKASGDSTVNELISRIHFNEIYPYAIGDSAYSGVAFLDTYLSLQNANIPETDKAFVIYEIAKSRGEEKYAQMVNALRNKTSDWTLPMLANVLKTIDLSIGKLINVEDQDKVLLTAYLSSKSENLSEDSKKSYVFAINKLNNVDGIKFENLNLNSALQKAGEENKLVFLDAFTTWCGPCKKLDAYTFTQKSVGDYFNKNFVNIKIDMEKGEGINLREQFEITAFPTMLILDSDGNIVKRLTGAMSAEKLLELVQQKL